MGRCHHGMEMEGWKEETRQKKIVSHEEVWAERRQNMTGLKKDEKQDKWEKIIEN